VRLLRLVAPRGRGPDRSRDRRGRGSTLGTMPVYQVEERTSTGLSQTTNLVERSMDQVGRAELHPAYHDHPVGAASRGSGHSTCRIERLLDGARPCVP
jgi:hypothetical protein